MYKIEIAKCELDINLLTRWIQSDKCSIQ